MQQDIIPNGVKNNLYIFFFSNFGEASLRRHMIIARPPGHNDQRGPAGPHRGTREGDRSQGGGRQGGALPPGDRAGGAGSPRNHPRTLDSEASWNEISRWFGGKNLRVFFSYFSMLMLRLNFHK